MVLVQLEDYTNVSLVGKSKTDLGSLFRSDLSPVSSNDFQIDTGLQPCIIIPLSSTNTDKGGLIGGFVHILCLHLISLHPSAALYGGHPLPVNAISLIQLGMQNDASESISKD